MVQWYYHESGIKKGPVSEDELIRLGQTRRIKATDLVWNESLGKDWVPAENIDGLIPPPEPASAKPAPVMASTFMAVPKKKKKSAKELLSSAFAVFKFAAQMAILVAIVIVVKNYVDESKSGGSDSIHSKAGKGKPIKKTAHEPKTAADYGRLIVKINQLKLIAVSGDKEKQAGIYLYGTILNNGSRNLSGVSITAIAMQNNNPTLQRKLSLGKIESGETKAYERRLSDLPKGYDQYSFSYQITLEKVKF